MRVRWKFTLVIVTVLIVALATSGLLAWTAASTELLSQTEHRLSDVAELKAASYAEWIAERARSLEQLARRQTLQSTVEGMVAGSDDVGELGREAAALLESELAGRIGFRRLFVVSARGGQVLASTDPTLAGTLHGSQDWFAPGLLASYVATPRWSLRYGETVMPVATPLLGNDGTAIAIVVGDADLRAVDAIVNRGQSLSTSEDTYLVGSDNFPMTVPRFAGEVGLQAAIRTEGVEACLAGETGVRQYIDYQGAAVLGAYRWLPDRGACLVTEVDQAEALAPLDALRSRLFVLVLALLVVSVGVAALASARVTRPIIALAESAAVFGTGDLGHRIGSTRSDEFGDLADALDTMAIRLQSTTASRDDLDTEVARRRALELELQRRAEQLERSNEDLQQFAYVASHDLQEPLRMVASYLELLARRYRGQLDADADEFIGYAVDGAVRMKALINDLLAMSRVDTQAAPPEAVAIEAILDSVMRDLAEVIEDAGATLVVDVQNAVVVGDPHQIVRLFQNLISNAVKFRGNAPPMIHITADEVADEWIFHVRDNGIGIEPRHFDQIFVLFQRLGDRDEKGTGIGLALCKKIVARHGGAIWVTAEPGVGSTFHVRLPKAVGAAPAWGGYDEQTALPDGPLDPDHRDQFDDATA